MKEAQSLPQTPLSPVGEIHLERYHSRLRRLHLEHLDPHKIAVFEGTNDLGNRSKATKLASTHHLYPA